jgi:hypothetical protein
MTPDEDLLLRGLLRDPRERLNVEHKAWIDPHAPEGTAKIARAALALWNINGGYLIIGLDKHGKPAAKPPAEPHRMFHQDVVQGIVKKHSAESFEVVVHHIEEAGAPFVVVVVPNGVRSPTAAKRDLFDAAGKKKLVREHAVYVRTLHANNTVSTDEARHSDWPKLLDVCFENREADIGRFLRRHLTGPGLSTLQQALGASPGPGEPDVSAKLKAIEERGRAHFEKAANGRLARPTGTFEVTVLVDGVAPVAYRAGQDFTNRVFAAQPQLTGWPAWVDSRGFAKEEHRPYVLDDGWEALIVAMDDWSPQVDFWRMEPGAATFYRLALFPDDLEPTKRKPQTLFDMINPIWRVYDSINVVQAFAVALGYPKEETTLRFRFRWEGLEGRVLASWTDVRRWFSSGGFKCRQPEVVSEASMPLAASRSAQGEVTLQVLRPLYEVFAGFKINEQVVDEVAKELFRRVR